MEISKADSVIHAKDRKEFRSPFARNGKPKSQRTTRGLVFGHSDADGHLAAEQTRTNLEARGVTVETVLVSAETRNYRFWQRTFTHLDFTGFDEVVVVDIMFNPQCPGQSLDAVLEAVDNHPKTNFMVIDHHPLIKPERTRTNFIQVESNSVYECCFGTPSDELMVVAAICDRDVTAVRTLVSLEFERRATGVRRAAADVHGLVGPKLLTLLCQRDWAFFEALAVEPAELHLTARGRRRASSPPSPLLQAANAVEISVPPTWPPVRQM